MSGPWDGVSDFYEDDESVEVISAIRSRPVDTLTARRPTVLDVAAAFLKRTGQIDAYKLQKLCYYAQAEHLVRFGEPLFHDRIEAWQAGPVAPALFREHAGKRVVTTVPGDPDVVAEHPTALKAVDEVMRRFGSWSGAQLSELSHRERPWADARVGLPPKAMSQREISTEAIRDFYSALRLIPDEPL